MIIHTHKTAKTVKRTLLSVGILLLLIIIGGAAYVYISDRDASVATPETPVAEKKPLEAAPTINPDAPASAAVQFIESPVSPGKNSSIIVQTNPRAVCSIVVAYNNIVSKDSGLINKTADVHGSVSWAWTVDADAPVGKWPVKVTCKINNKTGYVEGNLIVEK